MNSISLLSCVVLCLFISGSKGFTVSGNQLIDPNGQPTRLRGVDRPSFEWSATGEMASANDYLLMAGWGANVVRLATNQEFWLSSSSYAETIDQQIEWANAAGMALIIDLHWNNASGQQEMADQNSITYWSQVAARYKGNPWVMFELYNEPNTITWDVWLNGNGQWAGMQQLYNAVRAAGAENTVLIGGLNWAFDLSGIGQGYAVQGYNIMYATHPYDYAGKQTTDWPSAFGYLVSTYPVMMTEFGQYCNTDTYDADVLAYAEANGIHWSAWAWYVSGCSFPSIISDWNGTPISGVGQLVQSYLSGNPPTSAVTSGTTATSTSATSATSSTSSSSVSPASGALVVYTGTLASGWQDWSWSTSYSLSDTTYVQSGSASIKFQVTSYQGVYLHYESSFTLGSYSALQFYVNGGTSTVSAGSVFVEIYGTSQSTVGNNVNFPASATAGQWTLISIPTSSFGVATSTQITGFAIAADVQSSAGTIWISDISFVPAASSSSAPTPAPTSAPTSAPTHVPTNPPTSAPTHTPTNAPTHTPTNPPTSAPTHTPTSTPTHAPTNAPTSAPTNAPTHAPTSTPTHAPTSTPTSAPTHGATHAPTNAPTSAPSHGATSAPTAAPSESGCGSSSIQVTQTVAGSWQSGMQTVTQYTVQISTTCATQNLVALTLTASNWNPVDFWNAVSGTGPTSGGTVIAMPAYFVATHAAPFSFGYQNVGGEASFSVSSFTYQ